MARPRHKGVAALSHLGTSPRMTRPRFNRILLKLSGEALMGPGQFGIDPEAVDGAGRRDRRARRGAMSCAWSSAAATSSAAWPRQPRLRPRERRLHGHAGDGDERARAAGRAREARRRNPRPVRDPDGERVASPTSAAARSAISRRAASSCSPPAPAIPISRPTPPPRCARPRWAATPCSRGPASTASTPPTRRR